LIKCFLGVYEPANPQGNYNYLPALEHMKQSAQLSEKFNSFGNRPRLSMLGYDSNPFTGDPDLDHWWSNARHFKHEVCGRTYKDCQLILAIYSWIILGYHCKALQSNTHLSSAAYDLHDKATFLYCMRT